MTLAQLEYFYYAATLENFIEASKVVNISQPSLSRAIKALEEELDVILFEKKGRNVKLTKTGSILLEHATTILNEVKRTKNNMNSAKTDGGTIDLAYVTALAPSLIPQMIRNFLKMNDNKNVSFNFHQDITARNIEGLKKGLYDIVIGSYASNEDSIEFTKILEQEMVVIIPKDHPLSKKDFIEPDDFKHHPLLGYIGNTHIAKTIKEFFIKNNIDPTFICESTGENGIAALVAENFGIAIVADVPSIYLDDIVIKHLNPKFKFYHNVYMCYIKNKYQLPAVKRLIQFIKDETIMKQ